MFESLSLRTSKRSGWANPACCASFFKAPVDFPEPANREAPARSPKLHSPISTSFPLRQPTPATPLVLAKGCTEPHKRGHRTTQQKAQARTREHERPVQQDAQPSAAEGTGPHDTKTLTGLFRRDEEAAGSRRLGWRGSLPAVLPCRGMENAARCIGQRSALHLSSQHAASGIAPHCIRHRTALRFGWHSSGKQGEATWTGATRAVRCPPFCLQSIGTPYSACRNRRISAKSINFVQLWKSRQGNTMRAVQ